MYTSNLVNIGYVPTPSPTNSHATNNSKPLCLNLKKITM